MWPRFGGWGTCKCCRCENCCGGNEPYEWDVDLTGLTDSQCLICDEYHAGIYTIAPQYEATRCIWEGVVAFASYDYSYEGDCKGPYGDTEFFWQVTGRTFSISLTIACIDADNYGITLTISQEWDTGGFLDPVDCCLHQSPFLRRSVWHYYATKASGAGDCAAWAEVELALQSTDYEYRDETDPLHPFWTAMTPETYTPCELPATLKIYPVP